ncbi:triphosphoribosyl-dephospho-CoA synthase [Caloramator quimbayensis]|nr:triphosphoribosyl-dephospho-CoA synthase [Caloramator quimbayensis]
MHNFYSFSPISAKIAQKALCSMLYEVSTSPSPGLVSPVSKGCHNDMDYFTFLISTSSIAYYLPLFIEIGIKCEDDVLKSIREVGKQAEEEMLRETEGVNTQRGLLFLIGVLCGAAGVCIKKSLAFNRYNLSEQCSIICKDIVKNELLNIDRTKKLTNGERLYLEYKVTGIRGEVEKGLPTVINTALPSLEDALNYGLNINDALSHTLISIMSCVEDTTVINRCKMQGIYTMRNLSKKALELGGMKSKEGREFVKYMEDVFVKENISPGGAADLLAAAHFIYQLENMEE